VCGSGSGPGWGKGSGCAGGNGSGGVAGIVDRAGSLAVNGTSHSQQSLQRLQRMQRWFAHVSLVQYTQIS